MDKGVKRGEGRRGLRVKIRTHKIGARVEVGQGGMVWSKKKKSKNFGTLLMDDPYVKIFFLLFDNGLRTSNCLLVCNVNFISAATGFHGRVISQFSIKFVRNGKQSPKTGK